MTAQTVLRIKNEFGNILKIIHQAYQSYRVLHYLWTTSGDEVIDSIKGRDLFLSYCKERFFKDTVIEMSKLFHKSDNEHFNLQKFINRLENDKQLSGVISQPTLSSWRSQLDGATAITGKIIANRSGYAAHTDRNFISTKFPLSLKELRDVIDISHRIAKDIFLILDGSDFRIDQEPITGSPLASLTNILTTLAEKEKDRLRPLLALAVENDPQEKLPNWFKDELSHN